MCQTSAPSLFNYFGSLNTQSIPPWLISLKVSTPV